MSATITPATAALDDNGQYGGYVVLTPQLAAARPTRVPYRRVRGRLPGRSRCWRRPSNGFPWLAVLGTNGSYWTSSRAPATGSTLMQGGDFPYLLVHLEHQSRRLTRGGF